jgi:two-component system nitrate/nitrite response regulator NarL
MQTIAIGSALDRPVRTSGERIRVFVAESSRLSSQLMEAVLQRHRRKFEVRAVSSGSTETFRELETNEPQVAIISAELQDGPLAGFQVLHKLRDSQSKTSTIMLLNSEERDLVVDAFRAGARGIFARTHSIDDLPRCICAVHQGLVWLNNEQVQFLLEQIMRLRPLHIVKPGGMALLTHREQEIVSLVAEGMRNEEVSQKLNLTEHTVRNYLCRIFEKLGISSRVELVLYALSR